MNNDNRKQPKAGIESPISSDADYPYAEEVLDDQEVSLLREPPIQDRQHQYWQERFPVTSERIARSTEALIRLQREHPAQQELELFDSNALRSVRLVYPWRHINSPATGLPAFLRIWLDGKSTDDQYPGIDPLPEHDEEARHAAWSLVSRSQFAPAMFGSDVITDEELREDGLLTLRGYDRTGAERYLRHFSWGQTYRNLPVIGGSVRVHELAHDGRAAISSSYFPVGDQDQPPDATFVLRTAVVTLRALQAAALAVPGVARASVVQALIEQFRARWSLEMFFKLVDDWPMLGGLVREYAYAAATAASAEEVLIDGSELAILPFDSEYHLIRRVRIALPEDDAWFVDIDAQTGMALGGPWQAALGSSTYFRNSYEALDTISGTSAGTDTTQILGLLPGLDSIVAQCKDGGSIVAFGDLADQSTSREVTNVAVHAKRLIHHLRDVCGVDPDRLLGYSYKDAAGEQVQAPGLAVAVNVANLPTRFIYDQSAHPKVVRFQLDDGGGIGAENERTFHPALDPEVVLHEFTHAFLWLLNAKPWDMPGTLTPFGRALQEGYAMYLARSLGARAESKNEVASSGLTGCFTDSENHWARAAYRCDVWGDAWRFARADKVAGADLLPAPDTYPTGKYTTQMDAAYTNYHVGMVWARALWDLREALGPDVADFLAVQAYPYLHGYTANFTLAAEALLNVDVLLRNDVNLLNGTEPIWAGRGIAAGQGVFGFARNASAVLFAAGRAGTLRSEDNGQTWLLDNNLAAGGVLSTVSAVAVAPDSDTFLAAAQQPVISSGNGFTAWYASICHLTDNGWQPVGAWANDTANASPHCFVVVNDVLLVGSNTGIYTLESPRWRRVGSGAGANAFLAVSMAATQANGETYLHACTPARIMRARLTDSAASALWFGSLPPDVFGGAAARPTAIVEWQAGTYVGTLHHGLWRLEWDGNEMSPIRTEAQAIFNKAGAILALAASTTHLYVATTNGVFSSPDGHSFTALPGTLPGDAIIMCLHAGNGFVLAGTLNAGILRHDGNDWESVFRPSAPGSAEVAAGASALVHIQRQSTAALDQVVMQNQGTSVALLKAARFGPPLQSIPLQSQAAAGVVTYNLTTAIAGPIMLLLENNGATDVQVALSPFSGGPLVLTAISV